MAKRKKKGQRLRCGAKTKAGKRCQRQAVRGTDRCANHPRTQRRGPHKGTGGRPRASLDQDQWRSLDIMCNAGVPQADIAEAMRVDVKTLGAICQRDRGLTFSQYRQQKKGKGRAAIAAKQFQVAMSGQVAMLIWLGKQWLGQREPRLEADVRSTVVSHDEWIAQLAKERGGN